MTATQENHTSPALITLAWIIVLIPTAWGVYNTILNAMKLFQ